MNQADVILQVNRLTFAYDRQNAVLSDVSLCIPRNSFTVIIGPSGAGKSTLLRCICGFLPTPEGSIMLQIDQRDNLQCVRPNDRQIAMIFQNHCVVMNRSVIWNVLVGRLSFVKRWRTYIGLWPASDHAFCLKCLDAVGITQYAHRQGRRLSGGQLQRVGIARALAQEPVLLLADEPTANLDQETAEGLMDLLNGLRERRGMTILAALHNIDLVRRYSTHVIAICGGRLAFFGTSDQLKETHISGILRG